MDIFNFITLAGGLAFFLYGMHVMSAGLEKMAGGKLERILKKMTSAECMNSEHFPKDYKEIYFSYEYI